MFYVNGTSVVAIGLVFPILGLVMVLARYAVRLQMGHSFKADDWLCIPAWLSTTACGIMLIYGASVKSFGYESSMSDPSMVEVEAHRVATQFKLVLLFNIVSILAVGFIKLSLCFFYRRIFCGRIFDIVSWTIIGILITWTAAFFILAWAQCGTYMTELLTSGTATLLKTRCLNTTASLVAMAVSDLILDVVILLVPLFWIWPLKITVRQKLAISAVFMVGIFATATAAVRTAAIIELGIVWPKMGASGQILGYTHTDDVEGVQSVYIFWSYISTGTGMAVSCLPALRAAFNGSFWSGVVCSVRNSSTPLREISSRYFSRTTISENTTRSESISAWPLYALSQEKTLDASASIQEMLNSPRNHARENYIRENHSSV